MPALDRTARYSTVAIWFHWTIAVLVIFNLAVGILHDYIPALNAWIPAHKALGLTVLVLTAGRVLWRILHAPPLLPEGTPAWAKGASHATHWTLYALLIVMPLTGWMMVSGGAKRYPLNFFGLFDIPYLPVSKATGGLGANAHGLLGWLMLALVAVHIAAALRHHFLLRDAVLLRMLPARRA